MSNPVLALFLAALLWFVPLASRAHDGDHVEVTGEFEVIQADDFEHGRSELHYFVNDRATGQSFELHFDGPPPPFRTGQQVSVRGRSFGRALHSASVAALGGSGSGASGGQTAAAATTGERNVVALLVDLNDATASSRYTVSQVTDALWTGARSVDGLLRTASFSQLGLAPDPDGDGFAEVFGPYGINDSASPCDYTAWADAADAAASADGVNLSLYRHRVYVLPRYNELSCGWAGLANVGCGSYCRSWIAEGESPMVYAHELGHNLSMHHAATDPENDGIVNVEYGDGSDPMGSSRQWRLFNAPHVDQLGWLQAYPGSIVEVTANGSYNLFPIGLHPSLAAGPQILRVPRPGAGGYYYLSFRRALDYDATISSTFTRGVSVHSYAGAGASLTYFINSLVDGGIFQDAANGIEVQQQFRTPDGSSVSVQVSFTCIPRSPTLTLSPASQATNGSSSPRYTITVANRDGSTCDPASFALSGSFPAGIQGTLTPSSLVLAPGASTTATLDLTTSTTDGRFGFSVQAADALRNSSGSAEIVVDTLAPLPATLTGTLKRRAQIQLNWSGASDGTGSGLSAYRLHREGGSGAAVNVITSSTSYLDTSTVSGVTYTYTVHARDAAGNESVASNAATINTGSTTSGGGKGGKAR